MIALLWLMILLLDSYPFLVALGVVLRIIIDKRDISETFAVWHLWGGFCNLCMGCDLPGQPAPQAGTVTAGGPWPWVTTMTTVRHLRNQNINHWQCSEVTCFDTNYCQLQSFTNTTLSIFLWWMANLMISWYYLFWFIPNIKSCHIDCK